MGFRKSKYAAPFRSWLALPVETPPSLPTPTDTSLPLLVVGAGPAGLAAMAALREAGVAFEGVESHSQVGGIWDIANPLSSVYEGLATVTSRYTSHLGTPLSSDWPNYLPHEEVLKYFLEFASTNQLLGRIRLSTRFVDAVKTERGTWRVSLQRAGGDDIESIEYRGIIIATGSHNKLHKLAPRTLWDQAEAAGIRALHSADYKSPAEFAGKRVLVIGMGNSGTDIAEKISASAARTLLVVRTPGWINPPTMLGTPCDKLAAEQGLIPDWIAMPVFHAYRRLVIGSFRRLGYARPKCRLNDRIPTTDRGIVRAIRKGRVTTRSEAVRFEAGQVHFSDPHHPAEPVDVVIFATGFERRYPMLAPEDTGECGPLFQLFHRTEPGLAFQTEMVGLRGCWPIFVEQGKALAAYFVAEQRGSQRVADLNRRRGLPNPNCKGKLFALGDPYHVDYAIYTRLVRDLVNWLSEDLPANQKPATAAHTEKAAPSPPGYGADTTPAHDRRSAGSPH